MATAPFTTNDDPRYIPNNTTFMAASDSDNSGVSSASTTINSLYVAIGSMGMLGNLFALVVILSSREMRGKVTTWYIANQSALDFGVSLMLAASSGVESNVLPGSGVGAQLYCRLWTTKVGPGTSVSHPFSVIRLVHYRVSYYNIYIVSL